MRSKQQMIDMITDGIVVQRKFIPGETYIPTSAKVLDDLDILQAIDACLDGWLTERRYAHEFNAKIRSQMGSRFSMLCNSGSSANLLAISALTQPEFGSRRILPSDEVVTTATGFPTTLSPIIQNKAIPVFVDVDFPTYVPSPDAVEAAIGPNTKAIFLAHTLGNPFDVEAMRRVADENNVYLIGDACDSLGASFGGLPVGALPDISTLSFFPAHQVTCGEGGAVVTNSGMFYKVIESLRGWGRDCTCAPGSDNTCGRRFSHPSAAGLPAGYDHKYVYARPGYNLKITDIQAAIGSSQIDKLPRFVEARRKNHARLFAGLKKHEEYFILPAATVGSEPSWFGFAITLRKSLPFTRLELTQYLESRKVGTRPLFGGNLLSQPAFKGIEHRVSDSLYNSDVIRDFSFWIGCHPDMGDNEVDYVLSVFDDFIAARGRNR